MIRIVPRIAILLGLLTFSALAVATPISVDPAASDVELGTTVSIDIVIAPETGLLIGGFDIVIDFDSAILSLLDVVFGTSLNDPADPFTSFIQLVRVLGGGGSVQFIEPSLLSVADLGDRQDGSPFVLFTLVFDTIGVGTGGIGFGDLLISNQFGNEPETIQLTPGSITVSDAPVSVPEPSSFVLLLTGLLLLARRKLVMRRACTT